MKIQKGEIVKIGDSTGTLEPVDGKLIDAHDRIGTIQEEDSREWEVLAVGCELPTNAFGERHGVENNTIIGSEKIGRVIFIHGEYLRSTGKRRCPECGTLVSFQGDC